MSVYEHYIKNENYLKDTTSLSIYGANEEHIEVSFPSEKYFEYMLRAEIFYEQGEQIINEVEENYFTALGKRSILVTATHEYLQGILPLDHLSCVAYRLRSKPLVHDKNDEIDYALYVTSQLAYYERHREQYDTFLNYMDTVTSFYEKYKEDKLL